ncbi:hypothetical protein [Microbacterium deminutum]|uniref:Uncharacterized protein n=1 Tax=Microbacterium deminutum TaxID=344164 RepID=A0ABN2R9X9_9MICO
MSTPEQPGTPPLTRKQMRDIRNTGSTPIVPAAAGPEGEPTPAPAAEPAPIVAAPLPRAAAPVVVPDAPMPDSAVDLGVSPLTRRQARQQERIRTASVPVITPEIAAAYTASAAQASAATPDATTDPSADGSGVERPDAAIRDLFGLPLTAETDVVGTPANAEADPWAPTGEPPVRLDVDSATDAADEAETPEPRGDEEVPASERAVVNPLFGAGLLAGVGTEVEPPPSFDQLLGRTSGGTGGTPHALIVPQASSAAPIVAPVSSTGEVLITGTLNLPEGLGSNGHAPGATDGKSIDASLVDGELPAHSSPTPIAASAAISTVKSPGEIIKPPAPEKGSKLMMTLAITAGVLALALVGVLILAFVTGVF